MGSSDQKNVFLAVILSGLVLVTWQAYFAPKPVPVTESSQTVSEKGVEQLQPTTNTAQPTNNTIPQQAPLEANTISTPERAVQTYTLNNKDFSVDINDDLSIVNIVNPDVKHTYVETLGKENAYTVKAMTATGYASLQFNLTKNSENTLTGVNPETGTRVSITLDDIGKVNVSLSSQNDVNYRLSFDSKKEELENRKFREYLFYKNSELEKFSVGSEEKGEGTFDWAAVDFNYHVMAVIMPKKVIGKYSSNEQGQLNFDLVNAAKSFEYSVVFAKKNYDTLAQYGGKLEHSVDFGFFAILAVPILRGLQFFYDFIPNYGVAIIFLTLIIRLITFPLQFKSFKSMKQMQKIQPDLAKLKEKYKDDPQRMQKETMELFKKAGANPLGGCLPMVLQMPVFFAFYQVLYNAYELVEAPFAFWIHDLSIKDPMYVLPVIMGIAMFGQTKLNPSATSDPMQKKMMLFMPVVFTFIMKDLPAGLNLYIFVSTVFGIVQQLFVYRVVK